MSPTTKRSWLLFGLSVVTFLGVSSTAAAQSVSIQAQGISRSNGFRPSSENPTWISRSDCVDDDVLNFPLTVTGYANYQLEAWVGGSGADCTAQEVRHGSSPTCWKVWTGGELASTNVNALIRVRDIVAQNKETDEPNGPNSGTIDDCTPTDEGTSAPQAITVYFLLVEGSGEAVAGDKWETNFDLVGPSAPTDVTAGVGDGLLVLNWTPSISTDLVKYNFYCDPVPGEEPDSSTMQTRGLDAGTDSEADSAVAEAGLDSSSDAASSSTSDGSSSSQDSSGSQCPTSALVAGQIPDDKFLCGTGSGSLGRVTGLENGVTYSVAIASVDGVGNVGQLSTVACAAPEQTDDFYSVYRKAGGNAGGGFCSVAATVGKKSRNGNLFWVLWFSGLAAIALLRRRG